ncbi:MAG: hypothetical protein JXQ73_14260 [Phycisphaerae bacterium]|nr:hypothetical protein [Phycisphaerae bacterium]
MKRPRSLFAGGSAVLLLLLATGCQNQFTLRVEKVCGVSSSRIRRESRIGRALQSSERQLTVIVEQCKKGRQEVNGFIAETEKSGAIPGSKGECAPSCSSPSPACQSEGPVATSEAAPDDVDQIYRPVDLAKAVRSNLDELTETLTTTELKAIDLRVKCMAYFEPKADEGGLPAPQDVLDEMRLFSDEAIRNLDEWYVAMRDAGWLNRLLEGEFGGALQEYSAAASKRAAMVAGELTILNMRADPGFGGFMTTDVYVVNPSDPKYEEVLGCCEPKGKWLCGKRRRLGLEPITKVSLGASGDSALMVVMEHPGQARIYQISNDPTVLARNVAMLVSKATAAAAKFVVSGAVPLPR